MSILSHARMPEHDQVAPAAVVFGVSDPDDTRVRMPRRLLVDIVAVVVDALDVDADQDALLDYLVERFADRMVVVGDHDRDEYERDDFAMWQACAAADEFAAAAESGVSL